MKYSICIDQRRCVELGIKNANQAAILSLMSEVHAWAEPVIIDGEVFYWTARQKIAEELPLFEMKPDTVYRHLKALEQMGLIEYKKHGKKDVTRLTKKGKSAYVGNESELSKNSEINPPKLGNESEKNSDLNPTDQITRDHQGTKDQDTPYNPPSKKQTPSAFDLFWAEYPNKAVKPKAKAAFDKAIKRTTIDTMLDAISAQKQSRQWLEGFIPHPSTWLNGDRWADEVQTLKGQKNDPRFSATQQFAGSGVDIDVIE